MRSQESEMAQVNMGVKEARQAMAPDLGVTPEQVGVVFASEPSSRRPRNLDLGVTPEQVGVVFASEQPRRRPRVTER